MNAAPHTKLSADRAPRLLLGGTWNEPALQRRKRKAMTHARYQHFVIVGRAQRKPGIQGQTHSSWPLDSSRAPRVQNDEENFGR